MDPTHLAIGDVQPGVTGIAGIAVAAQHARVVLAHFNFGTTYVDLTHELAAQAKAALAR